MTGKIVGMSYDNYAWTIDTCFIAIDDNSSPYGFYFHQVRNERMCLFAERCVYSGYVVKVICETSMFGANTIRKIEIEHGSSNATKWW